jgi:hypothetical protein
LQGSLSLISDAIRCGGPKLVAKLALAYGFYTVYSAYQLLTNKTRPRGV